MRSSQQKSWIVEKRTADVVETPNEGANISTIVTRVALEYLRKRVNGKVAVGINPAPASSYQTFQTGNVTLISRVLVGQFPSWEAVMPKNPSAHAAFESASSVHRLLQKAAKCADERSGCVRFAFTHGSLEMTANSIEKGTSRATAAAVHTQHLTDRKFIIGLSSEYVLDFLRQAKDLAFDVHLKDPQSAVLFQITDEDSGIDWRMILMPMRL